MKKRDPFDFWYAVNNTEILRMPAGHLETFGTTILHYHLVSELMVTVGRTRVREGRMQASRPQIIAPQAYSRTVLEGFGKEAHKYVDWLKEHEKDVRVLQYGYRLKKENFSEHIISESVRSVAESVDSSVAERNDPLSAVVIGVDDPWDVCLVKLFWEVIQRSAAQNVRELEQKRLFDMIDGIPKAVRDEIAEAFTAAASNPSLIKALGKKLQEYDVFEQYQDRFFDLVKRSPQ